MIFAQADPAVIVDAAKRDNNLVNMVNELRSRRYSQTPESFESLLWLLAASAMCHGARIALGEIKL